MKKEEVQKKIDDIKAKLHAQNLLLEQARSELDKAQERLKKERGLFVKGWDKGFTIGCLLLFLSSCASTMQPYPTHRHNIQGAPRYGATQKVYNFHNGHTYRILAPEYRNKPQVFYAAIDVATKDTVHWLPEGSVEGI